MKKVISIILVCTALLTICLSGCDSKSSDASTTPTNSEASGSPSDSASPSNSASPTPGDDASPSESPSAGSDATPTDNLTNSPLPTDSATPDETPSNGGGSGLSGSSVDVLTKLVDDIAASGIETPMCLPPTLVPQEGCQNSIGLSESDYAKYVEDAAQSLAAIGTFAHQLIIIKGIDDDAAEQIKKLVSGDDGYDTKKWICVYPQEAVAVNAGVYVLLAAAKRDVVDKAVEIFTATAGSTGEPIAFWDYTEE